MRPDSVSVLIAAYNADRWLGRAIESALDQTHPQVEVIVVDDGSTDRTFTKAQSYERQGVKVIRQENLGACTARNRALGEAKGEFIKFLDADDALTPDAIAVQLDALAPHRADRYIVPYGDAVPSDEALRPLASASSKAPPPQQVFSLDLVRRLTALLGYNIQTSLPLHRRELLQQVGGFRPDLKRGQEYDLHLRLALAGARFLHVAHPCSYVRHHTSPDRITNTAPLLEDSQTYLKVQVERREMLEAALGAPLPLPILAALSQNMWAQTRRLVREGMSVEVGGYLSEARFLDPNMRHAGGAYRMLGRALGPVRAERFLIAVRKACDSAGWR